jgi:hypothetical protein
MHTGDISFTPAADLLGHTAPLDQRAHFPLLGLPLEVRSNSAAVIAAAERSFGQWRDLDPNLVEPSEPLIVNLVVHPGESQSPILALERSEGSNLQSPFVQRVHGSCFLAASGENLLTAQMDRGLALGFVTPELVADDLHFRYNVLECLALLLASWRDRTPVHAGAIVHMNKAVLLVGESMAGKSTLCYAAVRAGFQLLAEDVVYVSTRGGLRLWGNPWRIHLLPDARRLFPELADLMPQIQANGKLKLAVDVATAGAGRMCRHAERALVCLIQRHHEQSSALEPIEPRIAIDALSRDLEAGFDLHVRAREVASALVERGAYRLWVGRELEGAVQVLRGMTSDRDSQNPKIYS